MGSFFVFVFIFSTEEFYTQLQRSSRTLYLKTGREHLEWKEALLITENGVWKKCGWLVLFWKECSFSAWEVCGQGMEKPHKCSKVAWYPTDRVWGSLASHCVSWETEWGRLAPRCLPMWGIWAPPSLTACVGSWASHIPLVLLYFGLLCKMKFRRKTGFLYVRK